MIQASRVERSRARFTPTNGFVDRLQGTMLQEHRRVAFRRRCFSSRPALQRNLDAFMRFFNDGCPHQGCRACGRTPASMFWGAVEV